MSELDLASLSVAELKALQKDVGRALKSYDQRQRRDAIIAAEAVAVANGTKLSDLMISMKARKRPSVTR